MSTTFDRVLKFGGAALSDGGSVRRVVRLVPGRAERPVLVASAHRGVTRALGVAWESARRGLVRWDEVRIRHRSLVSELGLDGQVIESLLRELGTVVSAFAERGVTDEAKARDLILSFGERLSARIVAAAFRDAGVEAFAADAFELGLEVGADGLPTAACTERVRAALEREPGIPIVTGFLARGPAGHLATLGADGSDLSAVWLGNTLGARRVEFFKTVPGWLTVDPTHHPDGRTIEELPLELARTLSRHGPCILQARALDLAGRTELVVVDVRDASIETRIVNRAGKPGAPIGLAVQLGKGHQVITIVGTQLGGDRDHAERWVERVGTTHWLGVESELHALTVRVANAHSGQVIDRWHRALVDAEEAASPCRASQLEIH